jgi:preprotein translocase subunit SecA
MNLQRSTVYDLRKVALETEDASHIIQKGLEELAEDIMSECIDITVHAEEWYVDELREHSERIFGMTWDASDTEIRDMAIDDIRSKILSFANESYQAQEDLLGTDVLRELEKKMLLHFTDQFWKDHLLAMDRLRHGVSLRGYGQQNPLLEYKREGTEMFMLMCSLRDEAVLSQLLKFTPDMLVPAMGASRQATQNILEVANRDKDDNSVDDLPALPKALPSMSTPKSTPPILPVKGTDAKLFGIRNGVDKNAPCPCGSMIKFKKCCRKVEVDAAELALAKEDAAERKAALANVVAQREEAMRQAKEAQEAKAKEAQEVPESNSLENSTDSDSNVPNDDLAIQELPDGLFAEAEDQAQDSEPPEEDSFFSKSTFEDN